MVIITDEARTEASKTLAKHAQRLIDDAEARAVRADEMRMDDTAHEFRVAIVALRRAIAKAQAQA